MHTVGGRIMTPKDVHILIPKASEMCVARQRRIQVADGICNVLVKVALFCAISKPMNEGLFVMHQKQETFSFLIR